MEIKEIFTFYGPSKSPTTTTTYIHTTKDSLAPLFYLQQCSSRWANPPCYRVIELLMDFVSSYQKEIRQIFTIKQKYYQTAGFWVLLHNHLSSFCYKGWDGHELLVQTDHFKGCLWIGISTMPMNSLHQIIYKMFITTFHNSHLSIRDQSWNWKKNVLSNFRLCFSFIITYRYSVKILFVSKVRIGKSCKNKEVDKRYNA